MRPVYGDLTDDLKLKYLGISALIQLDRHESGQARAAADEAMRLTAGRRPTYFGTFFGVAGPAEVYLSLWEAGHPSGDPRGRATEALGRLSRFADVFPVGRPRSLLLHGRHAALSGHLN